MTKLTVEQTVYSQRFFIYPDRTLSPMCGDNTPLFLSGVSGVSFIRTGRPHGWQTVVDGDIRNIISEW